MEWLGYVFLGLFAVQTACLFRKPKQVPLPEPQTQFWLQDLIIALFCYGAFLATYEPEPEPDYKVLNALHILLSVGAGFLAAMDCLSCFPVFTRRGYMRAFVLLAVLIAFTFWWQICFLAWWFCRCVRFCILGTGSAYELNRLYIVLIVAVYGVAFFLPLEGKSGPVSGHYAYMLCWGSLSPDLPYGKMHPNPVFFGRIWLANPMFWVAFLFAAESRWLMAMCVAGVALGFGLSPYLFPVEELNWMGSPGYQLWIASMFGAFVFAAIGFCRQSMKKRNAPRHFKIKMDAF